MFSMAISLASLIRCVLMIIVLFSFLFISTIISINSLVMFLYFIVSLGITAVIFERKEVK